MKEETLERANRITFILDTIKRFKSDTEKNPRFFHRLLFQWGKGKCCNLSLSTEFNPFLMEAISKYESALEKEFKSL